MTARAPAVASKARAPAKPGTVAGPRQRLCVVAVSPYDYITMPLADGVALMRLLTSAVHVQRTYALDDYRERYTVGDAVRSELRMIDADQLVQPQTQEKHGLLRVPATGRDPE